MAGQLSTITHSNTWVPATKGFLLTHPVGVALIGGILAGIGTYWLGKKLLSKKIKNEPKTKPVPV